MSKSMWCDAVDSKPVKAPKTDAFSVSAFFWVRGRPLPHIGFYDYILGMWISTPDGYHYDPRQVEYFAYIDNPYK